jgi:histone H1/5
MNTQTIQHLRAEVEAASTLHTALARLGQLADTRAPTAWSGPLLDEIEDAVDEDGSYSRAAIDELRRRAASALANQYRVVAATIDRLSNGRQARLRSLLESTLATGTGSTTILQASNPASVLSTLVRSGELRLDLAQRAVQVVKTAAESASAETPVKEAKKPAKPAAKAAKKPVTAAAKKKTKAKPAAKAKRAKAAKKPAPKPRKASAKKPRR